MRKSMPSLTKAIAASRRSGDYLRWSPDDPTATYLIADRARMSRVARWMIDHKGGSWSAVDDELRQLQPTLNRLRASGLSAIRGSTFWQIQDLLRCAGQERLVTEMHRALFSEAAEDARDKYRQWIGRASGRGLAEQVMPVLRFLGGVELRDLQRPAIARMEDGTRGLSPRAAAVIRAQDDVISAVCANAACRLALARFAKRQWKAGHDTNRIAFGMLRIIGPLIASSESGGIERLVSELSDRELAAFIDAGVDRENILLKRQPERARAQEINPIVPRPRARSKRTRHP
jgi:hypothetical protein